MHSRGRRVRLRRHCMITRPPSLSSSSSSAVAPWHPIPYPQPAHATCHSLLPNLLAIWALCAFVVARSSLGACSICYLFLLCPAVVAWWHAQWGKGGGRDRTEQVAVGGGSLLLIWHRCISRLKLDNSSTRLDSCCTPTSLLSLAVFSTGA